MSPTRLNIKNQLFTDDFSDLCLVKKKKKKFFPFLILQGLLFCWSTQRVEKNGYFNLTVQNMQWSVSSNKHSFKHLCIWWSRMLPVSFVSDFISSLCLYTFLCASCIFHSFLHSVYILFVCLLHFLFYFFILFIYFSVCLLHFSFFSLCLWIFLCASCILHFVMCSQPLGCQMLSSAKCYTLACRQAPVVPTEFWLLQTPTAHALSCRWKLWNCRRVG